MSRNRNKKRSYRIQTGQPVSEVLLEVEGEDDEPETGPIGPLEKGEGVTAAEPAEAADFTLFVPITKIDEKLRQVWGRGAQEVPDATGEILDWNTSKPLIREWSEAAFKRSQGKSKGNIRAMHGPIAAGKLIDLALNDAEKAVDLGTEIVDDQEWRKCLSGVYTGFSIGGKYVKRWTDPANPSLMRYTARPTEFSLVDMPAIPTATIKLVKMDGTETELQRALPESSIVGSRSQTLNVNVNRMPAQPAPFQVAGDPGAVAAGEQIAAQAVPSLPLTPEATQAQSATPEQGLAPQAVAKDVLDELTARGARVGIARREGAPAAAPDGLPADTGQYADPANYGWPCDNLGRAARSIRDFNRGTGKEGYTSQEWAVLGRRVARLAGAVTSFTFKYDPGAKRIAWVAPQEANKMPGTDINSLVSQARTLLATGSPDAADQAAALLDVALDQSSGTAAGPTATATTTGSASTLAAGVPAPTAPNVTTASPDPGPVAAAAGPASPAAANSTPGPSTTGDNSATSTPDTRTPNPAIPSSSTTAKGNDMPTQPAAQPIDEPVTAPGAPALDIFPANANAIVDAKLPAFMRALTTGGKKALAKAFEVAERDQGFFDELYGAAMKHILTQGEITYDNRELISKAVIFGSKGVGAGDEDELKKGISSSFAPGIYLQRLVKLMLPIVSPIRNRLYTEQAAAGAQTAQWRAQLGFSNFIYAAAMSVAEAAVTIGSTTGTGQTINESSLTFAAPFVSTPNSNVVSLQAIAAGRGFDDPLQIAVIQSLTAMLKTEEMNLLYMSNASITMGTVTAASGAGGTLSAGSYTVKITALTGQGWRYTQDIPSYTGSSTYSVGGVSFATAGETAVQSAGSVFVGASGTLQATWASVKNAVAYNVYVALGANEYWQKTVTSPSMSISALATTGSSGPVSNTTANSNGYEGLVGWAELATIYGQAIPSRVFTDQAAARLTLAGTNSIKEWDTILKNLWQQWQIAPSLILMSAQGALNANNVVSSGSGGFPTYRIEAQSVQGQIIGGLMQTGYTNKFAPFAENMPRVVDILAHPYFPDGTELFLSETINYRMARETRGFKLETRIPYTYFPLGPTAPHYPFTVLVDETLECYHASAQAALVGVNDQ